LNYDELTLECEKENILVAEMPMDCYEGRIINNFVLIDSKLNQTQKACVLAEELGHYHTTVGNILDQTSVENIKQERKARIWAYEKQITMQGLVNCFEERCRNEYEMAESLGVTEEFLKDALTYYRQKYGVCTTYRHYTIFFEPTLLIHKKSKEESIG
jgi:Zn-dependent peptidase ImmA (M78 family)